MAVFAPFVFQKQLGLINVFQFEHIHTSEVKIIHDHLQLLQVTPPKCHSPIGTTLQIDKTSMFFYFD